VSRSTELTSAEIRHIHVAAGILLDADRVLLSERIGDSPFVGLWEFPGGKLDGGETADAALKRELSEELGIEVLEYSYLLKVRHRYADRAVLIDFFVVDSWSGEPAGCDGQALHWQAIDNLDADDLLPADAPVIDALKRLRRRAD